GTREERIASDRVQRPYLAGGVEGDELDAARQLAPWLEVEEATRLPAIIARVIAQRPFVERLARRLLRVKCERAERDESDDRQPSGDMRSRHGAASQMESTWSGESVRPLRFAEFHVMSGCGTYAMPNGRPSPSAFRCIGALRPSLVPAPRRASRPRRA